MSDNNEMEYIRKTLRIPIRIDIQIKKILQHGPYITESELIRQALTIGLKKIEGGIILDRKNKKN